MILKKKVNVTNKSVDEYIPNLQTLHYYILAAQK